MSEPSRKLELQPPKIVRDKPVNVENCPDSVVARSLILSDFRNYEKARILVEARGVVLIGSNGAGKTNLIEALSFLSPGRGLRRAKLRDVVRKNGGDRWSLAAKLINASGEINIGTGLVKGKTGDKRVVKINGKAAAPANLSRYLGVQWVTPQMDRLFTESASGRRRFLDRLVFGFSELHGRTMAGYERAMRERNSILRKGIHQPEWLDALEARMAADGVVVASSRLATVRQLTSVLATSDGVFPSAVLKVQGVLEEKLKEGPELDVEAFFRDALRRMRSRDSELGSTALGPHRSDLLVWHGTKQVPANQCSTGEQKALLIAIQLANVRLESEQRGMAPLLLLDEVAAHLDGERRAALFGELQKLVSQVWLTGTDKKIFEPSASWAQCYYVCDGTVSSEGW